MDAGSARVLPGSCQGPARVPKVRRKNMIYCTQGPRTPFGFYNNKRSGGEGARSAIAFAHVQRLALYRGHTAYGVVTLTASLEYFRAKKMQGNSCFRRICNRRQYFLPVWNSQGGNLPDIRRRGSSPKSTKEKDTQCASRVRQRPTRDLPLSLINI